MGVRKRLYRVIQIMLELVFEPTSMLQHVSHKLICVTNVLYTCKKQTLIIVSGNY